MAIKKTSVGVLTSSSQVNSARQMAISANEQFVGFEQIALGMSSVNQAAGDNQASAHRSSREWPI